MVGLSYLKTNHQLNKRTITMKRIVLTATLLLLGSAGAAFAASPDMVAQAVTSCCEALAACCGGGAPCCP